MDFHWVVDRNCDVTRICEKMDWHLASVIFDLTAQGLTLKDARAFAAFAIAQHAHNQTHALEHLDNGQRRRLKLVEC